MHETTTFGIEAPFDLRQFWGDFRHLFCQRNSSLLIFLNSVSANIFSLNLTGVPTLYQKSDLCIPRNEAVQPCPNSYIHVPVSDLNVPTIGLQQNWQTDRGNI
jgi:hypothetical protein